MHLFTTCVCLLCTLPLNCVRLFATLASLQPTRLLCPWEFSRQEYWSGLPFLPPGDLSSPGIEPKSPSLQVDSLPYESLGIFSNCIWVKPCVHFMQSFASAANIISPGKHILLYLIAQLQERHCLPFRSFGSRLLDLKTKQKQTSFWEQVTRFKKEKKTNQTSFPAQRLESLQNCTG